MPRRSTFLVLALVISLAPATAVAAPPSTMSYQGVLTDNLGNLVADGPYSLAFSLYDVPAGGSALWTETQNAVPVSKGGFAVILGGVNPLALAFDRQLWLGVAVNGGAELTPRVTLTSSASAFALRLPYYGVTDAHAPALSLSNTGDGADLRLEERMEVGNPITQGRIDWYGLGSPLPMGSLMSESSGGEMALFDEGGGPHTVIGPGQFGVGGAMYQFGDEFGFRGYRLDGNGNGIGDPFVLFLGGSQSVMMNMGVPGSGSVQLPLDAVESYEILDEPGIAQSRQGGSVVPILNTLPQDMGLVLMTTITIPGPGYIVVRAEGQHTATHNNSNPEIITIQIDEAFGGGIDPQNSYISYPYGPSGSQTYTPITLTRTFYKGAPGTYTFFFEGVRSAFAGNQSNIANPLLQAIYLPSAYGTVTATAEAGAPDVDLRELELRVRREQERLRNAENDLQKARFKADADKARAARPDRGRKP